MPERDDDGSTLLKVVQAAAISPTDAKKLVANLRKRFKRMSRESDEAFQHRIADQVADKVISRYAKLSAFSGGFTALTGVVPGIGTILAAVGGGVADTAVCMKLQVDMCMVLAETYGWDLDSEDARHVSFLIAAGGTLEHFGVEWGAQLGSKAGIRVLRQYLRGAALQAVKELFARIGIVFTRNALERALPFGMGVVIGSGADYALTRYVGGQARDWFQREREFPGREAADVDAA